MSRPVVISFKSDTSVDQIRRALAHLRRQQLVSLTEPVVVGLLDSKLRTRRTAGLAAALALLGAFWGVMVGLLFATPWLGLGLGAAAGTIVGVLTGVGAESRSATQMGGTMPPGQSALIVLAPDWADYRALERAVAPFGGVVLSPVPSIQDEASQWPALDPMESTALFDRAT